LSTAQPLNDPISPSINIANKGVGLVIVMACPFHSVFCQRQKILQRVFI
jgi:hypothetical protein